MFSEVLVYQSPRCLNAMVQLLPCALAKGVQPLTPLGVYLTLLGLILRRCFHQKVAQGALYTVPCAACHSFSHLQDSVGYKEQMCNA